MTHSADQTFTATVVIRNRLGLHARPAMALVEIASRFNAGVKVRKGSQSVDGKSIMQVMMLAATKGTELDIETSGPEAQELLAELQALVDRKFDEDD